MIAGPNHNAVLLSEADWQTQTETQSVVAVKYQDEEAVIAIPDGTLLEGDIRSSKLKLVQAWIEIHQDELMANWELATQGQQIFKIDPLR